MARIALFSDIHANIRALEAVFADLGKAGGADRFYALGDVIGYGPRPNEVLAVARDRFQMCVRGNHEHAVIHGATDFNAMAKAAIDWTRHVIYPDPHAPTPEQVANWQWLAALPDHYKEDSMLFVHGAPQDPVDEYILPMDIDPRTHTYGSKLQMAFQLTPWICFCGHSHYPGIYSENGAYLSPTYHKEVTITLDPAMKHIINVGSVGQPRDGDNRSCYAIYDTESRTLTWRRAHYDIQDVYLQIYAVQALDETLGDRLFRGE
ncbi:MAG: metallophosphoesterase family protein [Planctomycetota bacterium]|jgi:diadenosine tetraphosphatase ApaH/serine/threonine PP2A family protein phosphatase